MANSGGRRDQSSLLFFHKIHCGIMSIDKDKYSEYKIYQVITQLTVLQAPDL